MVMNPVRLALVLLVYGCTMATIARAEATISHEALLARLGANHPEYRAMQAETVAAREAIDAASALPDPEVRIELMDIHGSDLRPDKVGSTKYSIGQRLPLWGKRRFRREAATAAQGSAVARAGQTLAELRAQLRRAFSEYYAATIELSILEETRALLTQAQRSAAQRQQAGLASQQDLIRVQTEQSSLLLEAAALRGRIDRARIALNALVGAPLDAPLPPPSALPATTDFEAICTRVLESDELDSPLLESMRHEVRQRRAELDLANRERYPDLSVAIEPVQSGSRIEHWELMFGVSIPLHGSKQALERSQRALFLAAEERERAALLAVHAAAATARSDYLAARDIERIATTQLLPEARLGFRSALAGYSSAQLDFDAVVAAALQIRAARRQGIAAALAQQLAITEFERRTGVQP